MNGAETESLAELSRVVHKLEASIVELRGELKTSFVGNELYHAAHQALDEKVEIAVRQIAANDIALNRLDQRFNSRPGWAVTTILTLSTALNAGLVVALVNAIRSIH